MSQITNVIEEGKRKDVNFKHSYTFNKLSI